MILENTDANSQQQQFFILSFIQFCPRLKSNLQNCLLNYFKHFFFDTHKHKIL